MYHIDDDVQNDNEINDEILIGIDVVEHDDDEHELLDVTLFDQMIEVLDDAENVVVYHDKNNDILDDEDDLVEQQYEHLDDAEVDEIDDDYDVIDVMLHTIEVDEVDDLIIKHDEADANELLLLDIRKLEVD